MMLSSFCHAESGTGSFSMLSRWLLLLLLLAAGTERYGFGTRSFHGLRFPVQHQMRPCT
jgi:hypothetical protein